MAKKDSKSITFMGKEYRNITNRRRDAVDAVYSRGKVRIETWSWDGTWEAMIDYDRGNVEIHNQRGDKCFVTERAAIRDLETNARKFLRSLGVTT